MAKFEPEILQHIPALNTSALKWAVVKFGRLDNYAVRFQNSLNADGRFIPTTTHKRLESAAGKELEPLLLVL